ncbi:unnamed protein product [Fraxinus pennsylvanica]|uniref:Uncharacterized protein n=1 Tax=Fraxinus pennsylvanica TaxID=56036 RepID=A0AAD1Z5A5_9LAMI|nr:unnamed protein product [Fraxinus pennsylvanica]
MLPAAGQSRENHENIIFPVAGQSSENCVCPGQSRENFTLPSSSFAKRKSSIRLETSKSRFSLRDDIENLANLISAKISGIGPSIKECLALLGKIDDGVAVGSPTYFYACNFLCNKDNREMFIAIGDDTARHNWIMYNYNISKSNDPVLP